MNNESQPPAISQAAGFHIEDKFGWWMQNQLIMDGRILEDNLKRMGLDLIWLDRQLKQKHIHSAEEVFCGV